MPQVTPWTRSMTVSTSMPSTRAAMPLRLPLQPPMNCTFFTLPSSMSNRMLREQVPLVLYSYISIFSFVMVVYTVRSTSCASTSSASAMGSRTIWCPRSPADTAMVS